MKNNIIKKQTNKNKENQRKDEEKDSHVLKIEQAMLDMQSPQHSNAPVDEADHESNKQENDLYEFVKDLTKALDLDDENFGNAIVGNKAPLKKKAFYSMYDYRLKMSFDFVTNWVLLAAGRCNLSFMTLFAD